METETPSDLIIDNTIEQICDDNSDTIKICCCCMCTETFVTYLQLMAHIATTHSIIDQSTTTKDKFSCIFCMRKFKTNRILQCHQNRYQQRAKMEHKFYDCQSCKEKFCVMKDTLQAFLDKQDKTGRHRCVKCIEEKAKEIGKNSSFSNESKRDLENYLFFKLFQLSFRKIKQNQNKVQLLYVRANVHEQS
jgi:hypothetical protein